MIELKEIGFKYKDQKQVLKDVNLQIKQGEIVSIIGNNGEGKSTLARVMAGILKPTKGTVLLDGLDVYQKKNFKEIRKKVGIVFQNPDNQILFNRVYDDVEFALKNLDLDQKEERVRQSLKKVGMEEFENEDTFNLSLGQKQRINIASVLAPDPDCIILDEPTTMIDPKGKDKIYHIIKELKKSHKTIIYITNNIDEILLSDRIIILKDQKIEQILNKADLFENIKILEELNIKIPDMIQLVLQLNEKGFSIKLEDYTIQELVNKILQQADLNKDNFQEESKK